MCWRSPSAWAQEGPVWGCERGLVHGCDWAGESLVAWVETMLWPEKSGVHFSGTVEKYWDVFHHPALGTVYLSSFMHLTPSDTKWTLKAPSVLSCIYDSCCVSVEACEGCPVWLLGWLHWASFSAHISLSVPLWCAYGESSYAMALQEALKKQLIGNNYLNMTPHSIRRGTLFSRGPKPCPLEISRGFIIGFNQNGM